MTVATQSFSLYDDDDPNLLSEKTKPIFDVLYA